MPNVPTVVAFYKNNIIENYFSHFGAVLNCKSEIAEELFSNQETLGEEFTKWYNDKLKDISITTAIKFSFNLGYMGYKRYPSGLWYKIISKNYKIL